MAEAAPQNSETAVPLRDLRAKIESLDTTAKLEAELDRCHIDKIPTVGNAMEAFAHKWRKKYVLIHPYDFNLVRLKPRFMYSVFRSCIPFVNASILTPQRGYGGTEFIAAMSPIGPLEVTNFLQMLVEHQVPLVLMLTQLKERGDDKCSQYWPSYAEVPSYFESIKVTLERENCVMDYGFVERELVLKFESQRHKVTQLQFTDWSIPEAADIELFDSFFMRARDEISAAGRWPVVVHCSSGVGRTGVFVALHRLCHSVGVENNDTVDVIGVVRRLREDRTQMVQKPEQLKFIYEYLDYKYS